MEELIGSYFTTQEPSMDPLELFAVTSILTVYPNILSNNEIVMDIGTLVQSEMDYGSLRFIEFDSEKFLSYFFDSVTRNRAVKFNLNVGASQALMSIRDSTNIAMKKVKIDALLKSLFKGSIEWDFSNESFYDLLDAIESSNLLDTYVWKVSKVLVQTFITSVPGFVRSQFVEEATKQVLTVWQGKDTFDALKVYATVCYGLYENKDDDMKFGFVAFIQSNFTKLHKKSEFLRKAYSQIMIMYDEKVRLLRNPLYVEKYLTEIQASIAKDFNPKDQIFALINILRYRKVKKSSQGWMKSAVISSLPEEILAELEYLIPGTRIPISETIKVETESVLASADVPSEQAPVKKSVKDMIKDFNPKGSGNLIAKAPRREGLQSKNQGVTANQKPLETRSDTASQSPTRVSETKKMFETTLAPNKSTNNGTPVQPQKSPSLFVTRRTNTYLRK
jgi:hypothetical protein